VQLRRTQYRKAVVKHMVRTLMDTTASNTEIQQIILATSTKIT